MAARYGGPAIAGVAAVVRPLLRLFTRRDWEGAQLLPSGGFVLVANHISHADPLLLAHFLDDAGIPPRFLAKASVLELPILGRLLRATGQIPVYRNSVDASDALVLAVAAVQRGECIIVYPEATFTDDPALWPMSGKTGAARIALATGCPVVPVAQWGGQQILPPHAYVPRLIPRRRSRISVGPAVDLDDLRVQEVTEPMLREATERIMTAITRQLERVRGQRPLAPLDSRVNGLEAG